MKIAFLLPTLQFGRDGIADYTARLEGACQGVGHETLMVECGRNNWLRNPRLMLKAKMRVQEQVTRFAPDVVSWQFDGRIFHPLSVFPSWVIPRFALNQANTHLLAHETWEGDEPRARIRRRIKGLGQRCSFLRAIKMIAPDVTHTTNTVYTQHLESCGISSMLLPLFSSFPIAEQSYIKSQSASNKLVFVFFGGFHDHWNPKSFIESLKKSKKRIMIHHVGRHCSPNSLAALREGCQGWAHFEEHGLLSEMEVSRILLASDFAVSTYSLRLITKSSVYATFVDHGLPILVPRHDEGSDFGCSSINLPSNIILYRNRLEDLDDGIRYPIFDSVGSVADQFLKDIANFKRTETSRRL